MTNPRREFWKPVINNWYIKTTIDSSYSNRSIQLSGWGDHEVFIEIRHGNSATGTIKMSDADLVELGNAIAEYLSHMEKGTNPTS